MFLYDGVFHDDGQKINLKDALPDGASFVFENKKDTEGTPAGALSQKDTHAEPIASVSNDIISDNNPNSNKKLSDRNRKTAATLERENKRLKENVKYLRELTPMLKNYINI